jgi:hypothetical protein
MAITSPVNDPRGPSELLRHGLTYHRFMLAVKWFGIHLAAVIALLTLWFATPAGFGGGLFAAVVIVAIGAYAMNHGMEHSSEGDGAG